MYWLSIIVLSAIIAYVMRVVPIKNTTKHYHVSINSFSVLWRLTLEYLNGNIPHRIFWFYFDTLIVSLVNALKRTNNFNTALPLAVKKVNQFLIKAN